jgi:metal transporter CNNM
MFSQSYLTICNRLLMIVCVLCAAIAAGMTVGLLSLDVLKLKIKRLTGTEKERKAAEKILPLLKDHHLLLCTLLLFNALANESLPIFLDAVVARFVR